MSRLHDWKWEAEQFRDLDRAAQERAEAEIARRKERDAITGADPRACRKLNAALRKAWKLDPET